MQRVEGQRVIRRALSCRVEFDCRITQNARSLACTAPLPAPLPAAAPRDVNYTLMSFMIADQFPRKNSMCEVNLNTFDEPTIKYQDWANSGTQPRTTAHDGGGWCVTAQVSLRRRSSESASFPEARPQRASPAAWHARALYSIVLVGNSRTRCAYASGTILCLHDRLITFPELIMIRD